MTFSSHGRPALFRTPGYPFFLLLSGLSGFHAFGLTLIIQVILSVATVYLTYKLTASVLTPSAAAWAAGLQGLSLLSALNSVIILTECLYSFLFLSAFCLLVRHLQKRDSQWNLSAAALLAAASTYVRPVGLIWLPIVVAVLLYSRDRLRNIATFTLHFVLLVAPWYIRNSVETGYTGFSTVGDFNSLFYEAGGVWASVQKISIIDAQRDLNKRYRQELVNRNLISFVEPGKEGPFDAANERNPRAIAVQREMAQRIILAHLPLYLKIHTLTSLGSLLPSSNLLLEMLGKASGNTGTLSVLQQKGLRAGWNNYFRANREASLLVLPELAVMAVQYSGVVLFFFVGLLKWIKPSSVSVLIVLTTAAFIFVGGPASAPRMRLPVEPLLNLAAGGGIVWVLSRIRRGSTSGNSQ